MEPISAVAGLTATTVGLSGLGYGATALAFIAATKQVGNVVKNNMFLDDPPPRPLDVATLSITAKNASIDYASIRSCCDDTNNIDFKDLVIKVDYTGFLKKNDFIVLCDLPISTTILAGIAAATTIGLTTKNTLLLSDKTYHFSKLKFNYLGTNNSLQYKVDKTTVAVPVLPTPITVHGVGTVERICRVLKSSTVDPIQSVVFNSEGVINNKLLSGSVPGTIIVFIKHVLRNMAIVYGDQFTFNLQTTCINIDQQFSMSEQFSIPAAVAAPRPPPPPPSPQLYIFNNKLLSFWKTVTHNDYSSFLHFQVLFNQQSVQMVDVIFNDENDIGTLQKVRRDWIRDTFNGDNPKLVKGNIWTQLSKEGSSKNSSSLMDYKQEFQKSGSELMDKAIEDYKRALENGDQVIIQETAKELRKVETSLYFDAMKSESDTNIRRTLYQELNQISEKGRKFGNDALRRNEDALIRNENPSRRIFFENYGTDNSYYNGDQFRVNQRNDDSRGRQGGAEIRRGGLKSGKPRKARAKKTKKKSKEKNRLTQRK